MKTKNKSGFTLIEMIIAIAVFSIAMILLYDVVNMLNKRKDIDITKYKKYHKTQELKKLFYQDLMSEKDISIDNEKKISIFRTKNSLHGISYPFVAYILKKNILYRVESYKKIDKDIKSSMLDSAKILILLKACQNFLLFKDKQGIIVYMKTKNETIFKVNKSIY